MTKSIKPDRQLTFIPCAHGVKVYRGFNKIALLTWKTIRELEQIRTHPKAKDWLHRHLSAGPVAVPEIMRAALLFGISPPSLQRAKVSLGVVASKTKTNRQWRLPVEAWL